MPDSSRPDAARTLFCGKGPLRKAKHRSGLAVMKMPRLSALRLRHQEPELMDQPGLDPAAHRTALDGLRRINAISRSAAILWPAVRRLACEREMRSLSLLDLGCGGGDVVIRLASQALRSGLGLQVTGWDLSPVAIELARKRADWAGVQAEFLVGDVFRQPLPEGFDVVTCSLFLHHLDDADAVDLLRRMAEACRHLVLVNDLVRSRVGYLLAWLGCRVLTRSHVVRVDGPLSVRAAFTIGEVRSLGRRAGLAGATLSRHWPQRFLLCWRRR